MLPLYAFTLFSSALLVFLVQPMLSKLLLPYLGGTPAVWNTCLLFFQTALLVGYLYAHVLTRAVPERFQRPVHVTLLAASLAFLPIALPGGWQPSMLVPEALSVLGVLAVSVGIPFVLLSATAPTLQHWFGRSSHRAADHPYFLYAASNAGSLLALFVFPALLEPTLTGARQRWVWSLGYGLLVIAVTACAVAGRHTREPAKPATVAGSSVSVNQRLQWLLLAAVPSSLLLGVTTYLTTDVAAVPLLWIVPLALYLLSFILTFSRRQVVPHSAMLSLQTLLIVLVTLQLLWRASLPSWYPFALLLLVLFVSAMVCHRELVKRAPDRAHLTEFYLWVAAGGALGGAFNALLAPVLFDSIAEFPIAVAAACLMRPDRSEVRAQSSEVRGRSIAGSRDRWLDIVIPVALGLALAAYHALLGLTLAENFPVGFLIVSLVVAVALILSSARPLRFGLAVAIVLLAGRRVAATDRDRLLAERSFFGVYQVDRNRTLNANLLLNGTTLHGAQRLDSAFRRVPQTYYHPSGPLGQVMASLPATAGRRVGAIGLGTGAAACYARSGEHWVFYEIDPVVVRIARDTRFFSYLADCAPDGEIVTGDARLRLREAAPASFQIMILDAFTSDAIPVHLLTREAMRVYLDKLTRDGVLLVHLSNRFLDLAPVVARAAADAGLSGLLSVSTQQHSTEQFSGILSAEATWVVLARQRSSLGSLLEDPRWTELVASPVAPLWTDDFSNVLSVLKR